MHNSQDKFQLRGNPAQNRAILHDAGPALVLAGPGSGKTFVITERAEYLIRARHVSPAKVLTLTFTRAAAYEMKARFMKNTGGRYPEPVFSTFHAYFYAILRKYAGYTLRHLDANEIDFNDMVISAHKLLMEQPEVLSALQQTYTYLQVDEFQDVSPLQYEVIRMIAGDACNLFCVGDDDQSVYAFRGADPDLMKRFVASVKGVQVLHLNINYRCRERIIGLSKALIKRNRHRFQKKVKPGRKDERGKLYFHPYKDSEEEIRDVLCAFYAVRKEGRSAAIIVRTNEERERILRRGKILRYAQNDKAAEACYNADEHCVMTMHHAKGLEFDTVFLPRLNEGILPVHRSKETGRLEEERRLLYVGITRARMQVYLSCVVADGRDGIPSRFLKDILPYLRKHGTCAIFQDAHPAQNKKGSKQRIEGFGTVMRGTLSARLS